MSETDHHKQLQIAADMTRQYEAEQERYIDRMEEKYGPYWFLRDDLEETK